MGFLDRLKGRGKNLRQQASQAVDKHGDKISGGLDTAAEKANRATKGKYAGQISQGVTKAKDGLDKHGRRSGGPAPGGSGTGAPGTGTSGPAVDGPAPGPHADPSEPTR